jgi:hypothetical protein
MRNRAFLQKGAPKIFRETAFLDLSVRNLRQAKPDANSVNQIIAAGVPAIFLVTF